MKVPPKEALYRIDAVDRAWSNLRPNKPLGGMTLDEYRATTKASYDVRAEIAATEAKLQSLIAKRTSIDELSLDAASRAVNGAKADPEEGEDGELYAAMGFVRKSHRRAGRRRVKAPNGQMPTVNGESTMASAEVKAPNGAV